ncbi:MAG: EamA family transporter [Candidatus Omnitrophica bacterium]|nr:EamA family transporter [Candidatus Omnitrophota bacterium]
MNAVLWAILTACIWGVVPVLEKLGLVRTQPFTALFFRCLGVIIGIVLLGLFVVKPQHIRESDARSIGLLILSGFLASFVAQIAFYHGLKIGDVSRVVPISGTYPLIAFILGIFFLGEAVTMQKVFGMLFILAGVWLLRL